VFIEIQPLIGYKKKKDRASRRASGNSPGKRVLVQQEK
jgi:hypothetical protein